ncbi:tRNA (cytidine(34)-2'-O)-methyltransferase [Pseudokordiimonas caeni]|uniref:tRNA (cytidine(34)-2'-O)-methyltransferase n=1 Tax=Pseudokordiimonas caeni TaxID=2997908 RepID=UPI002810F97C|nr:tRNA (cytidine(34)-2'-O)-methyltransferase [Pseudokordiimonas caeni]
MPPDMDIALYEPDLPQNTGTMLRLAACMDVTAHVIEPCGFPFSIKAMKRSLMDYADHVSLARHESYEAFDAWRKGAGRRLVLLSTKASLPYDDFAFQGDDILMVGRESKGVPDDIAMQADARVLIPMKAGVRSLNVAVSLAMVLGEAMRQTGGYKPFTKGQS